MQRFIAQAVAPLWNRVFSTQRYSSSVAKNQAGVVYVLAMIILVVYSLYSVTIEQWPVGDEVFTLWGAVLKAGLTQTSSILFLSLYILCIVALVATRFGKLDVGSWSVVGAWYIAGVWLGIYAQDTLEALGLPIGLLILIGALVQRERGLYITAAIGTVTLWVGDSVRGVKLPIADLILVSINLLSTAGVLWLFLRYFRLSLTTSVTEAVEERMVIDDVLSRITQAAASRIPSADLMHQITRQIVTNFDHIDHSSIFLIEETGAEAWLSADSSQPSLSDVQRTRYGVGGLSNVGQATLQGRAIIERPNAITSLDTPLLTTPPTNTRTIEAVFPLKIGFRKFGALLVRSTVPEVWTEGFEHAFQTMADNLTLAIDNVRQFERAEQRLQENAMLIEQISAQLRDIDRLNQRLTGSIWTQYLNSMDEDLGLAVEFDHDTPHQLPPDSKGWTSTLAEAVRGNHIVQQQQGDSQVIAVPLRVRGQVVGAMEFELQNERGFTPEDLELVQEVSERFSLAAENSRLLDDSQRVAQREALVNQISAKLQTTTTVQGTLVEAARGLREALKAGKVAIRLGTPQITETKPATGTEGMQ